MMELQANKEAVPPRAQTPTASRFLAELRAEMPEVTEGKNKKRECSLYVISKSQQTVTETSGFCIEVFLPQGCPGSIPLRG